MKIGIIPKTEGNFLIVYQNGDTPVFGDDVVLSQDSVIKCLRALADWLQIKEDKKL